MPSEKFIRKITRRAKYSYSITLPKELVEQFKWRDGQKIVLSAHGKEKIIIADWKK